MLLLIRLFMILGMLYLPLFASEAHAQAYNMIGNVEVNLGSVSYPDKTRQPVSLDSQGAMYVDIASGGGGGGGVVTGAAGGGAGWGGYAQGSTTTGQYVTLDGCAVGSTVNATSSDTYPLSCTQNPEALRVAIFGNNGVTVDSSAAGANNIASVIDVGAQATTSVGPFVSGRAVSVNETLQGGLRTTPQPSSDSAVGLTTTISSTPETCHTVKASAGNLYFVSVFSTTAGFLEVFNSTTTPTNGTVTLGNAAGNMQMGPVSVAANGTGIITAQGGPPYIFTSGIMACISTTAGATFTGTATGIFNGGGQ